MKTTVFWSWQADQNKRVTRDLIRDSITRAIDNLASDPEVVERAEIDHDTKDVPGMPDIVASILDKIDRASVFIADITPIARSVNGKQVANPNVLIELGYAKKSLGPSRIITVWNSAFMKSRPEDLPFDLRGRRGPITYELPASADKRQLRDARDLLTGLLSSRLKECLVGSHLPANKQPEWHPHIESDPSIWWEPGVWLKINEGRGSGRKKFSAGGRFYVRVLPSSFDPLVLDSGIHGPLVGGYGGFSWGQTKGGLLTYSGSVISNSSDDLDAASMWFRDTGELWVHQTGIASEYRQRPTFFGDHVAEKWIEYYARCIRRLQDHGAEGPFFVKLGVTGMEDTFWPSETWWGGEPPIALEGAMEVEYSTESIADTKGLENLRKAWTELRRNFSLQAPEENAVEEVLNKSV